MVNFYGIVDLVSIFAYIYLYNRLSVLWADGFSLCSADEIYFFGFGYLHENLKFLKFENIDKENKTILGTGFGLNNENQKRLKEQYGITILPDSRNQDLLKVANNSFRKIT